MLVLGMNYLDLILKKEKFTSTFGLYFSYFGPFWVWAWQIQCYVPLNSYFTILPLSNTLNLPFGFQGHFDIF